MELFSMRTIRAYLGVMSVDDFQTLAFAFVITVGCGVAIAGALYFGISGYRRQMRAKRLVIKRAPKKAKPAVPKSEEATERRYIPTGAQSVLIERGKRQLQEGDAEKALVTYLSLLYTAVESKDDSALPAQLTDVLRGAAECYKRLGQPENAVKFLQAERRVFEEVVVGAAKMSASDGRTSILQSLLSNAGSTEDMPKRCATLSTVAEACTRLDRHDVALAYRVKAAAMKHKITGKGMDESSPEFRALAEALAKVQNTANGTALAKRALQEATSGENAVPKDSPLVDLIMSKVPEAVSDSPAPIPKSSDPSAASSSPSPTQAPNKKKKGKK
jgi:tetratricopeptide (TPR) repeat protein